MTCQFAHHDGSFVFGALSPAERQQFEQHLAGCAECAQSVRELAGLPGLLARIDANVLESPPIDHPVPDSLLPALVRQVRLIQRRRTFVTAGAAAAAAVIFTVGSLAVTGSLSSDRTPTSAQSPPSATVTTSAARGMIPVDRAPVHASLAFTRVAWGTRLDLTCTYTPREGEYRPPPPPATYALFVLTLDGRTEQVATWRSVPDKTMRLAAATAANPTDIASVEVRTTDGKPVLKLIE